MEIPTTLFLSALSFMVLNGASGQSFSINIETSFTPAPGSSGQSSESIPTTSVLTLPTAPLSSPSQTSSSVRETLSSLGEVLVSSQVASATATETLILSPKLSVSSVLASDSSQDTTHLSVAQDSAQASVFSLQTTEMSLDTELHTYASTDVQTGSTLTVAQSVVSEENSTINGKYSSADIGVPVSTSISLVHTISTENTTASSQMSISTTGIRSSSFADSVETTSSSPALKVETFELLESSEFGTQAIASQTVLIPSQETFTTIVSITSSSIPVYSHATSMNKGRSVEPPSDVITEAVSSNYFAESVYELANISFTSVPDSGFQSSTASSASESITSPSSPTLSVITSPHISSSIPSSSTSPSHTFSTSQETVAITKKSAHIAAPINETQAQKSSSGREPMASDIVQSERNIDFSFSSEVIYVTQTTPYFATDHPSIDSLFQYMTEYIEPSDTFASQLETVIPSETSLDSSESYFYGTQASVTTSLPAVSSSQSMMLSVTNTVERTSPKSSSVEYTTASLVTPLENSTTFHQYPQHRIYRFVFTFDGECGNLAENEVLREEFWLAFIAIIKDLTQLKSNNLKAENMLCDPLRIYLRIIYFYNTTGIAIDEILEAFQNKISSSSFYVPLINEMHILHFKVTKVEFLEMISDEPEVATTGLEVVDIVIISIASFLFAVLVLMMIIVVCRECYVRKRTTTFHLTDIPHVNLKLSDFTLTRIPRPRMFYRENSLRKPEPVPLSKARHSQNGHSKSTSNGKVKVNMDNINVRMRDHEGGLVVGITYSDPPSPTNDVSSSSSSPKSVDQSKRSLLTEEKKNAPGGVTNPNYSADEDVQQNTKIVIQDDENEQLV